MQVHQQGRQIFPNQGSAANRQSSNLGALMRSIANLSSHILSKFSSSGIVLLTANVTLIIFGLVYLYKKSTQYNAALKSSAAAEKLAIEAANKSNSTLQEEIIRLNAQNIPSVVSNSRIKFQTTPLNSPGVVYIPKEEAETLFRNLPSLISSGEEKKEEESIGEDFQKAPLNGFFKAQDVVKELDNILDTELKEEVSFNKKWMTYYVLACTRKLPNLKKYCEDILVKTLEERAEKIREEDFDILPFDLTNVYYKTDLSTISHSLTSLMIHITHPVALEGIERAMKKADVPDEDLEAFWEAKLELIGQEELKPELQKKDDETCKEYYMRFLIDGGSKKSKKRDKGVLSEILGSYIRYITKKRYIYNCCPIYSLKRLKKSYSSVMEVIMRNYDDQMRTSTLPEFRDWPNLHTLELTGKGGYQLNMDREKIASWTKGMPKLRHFNMIGVLFTAEEAFNLVAGFKNLETIKMQYVKSSTVEVDLTEFVTRLCKNHPNIRHLSLHGFPLSEKDVIYIALHCPLLITLDLYNTPMVTKKAFKIIGTHCKQLKKIAINYYTGEYKYLRPQSDISEKTIISFIESCPNLTQIKIPFKDLNFSDKHLFKEKANARINEFGLSARYKSCDITDDDCPLD